MATFENNDFLSFVTFEFRNIQLWQLLSKASFQLGNSWNLATLQSYFVQNAFFCLESDFFCSQRSVYYKMIKLILVSGKMPSLIVTNVDLCPMKTKKS